MQAIVVSEPGGPDSLILTEVPDVAPGPGEVLITVAAAGVNRADIGQRQGNYPPPPGAPDWPGLEVSGTISAIGTGVDRWRIGDRVCALLGGGGYATLAVAPAGQVLPVPDDVDLVDAAALPETVATVWSNVVMQSGLTAGETLLVHGGSSGIGTTAIQIATALGARVAVTAGTAEKLDACRALGADITIDYRREDFVARVLEETDGRGADVILDPIGGAYLDRNLRALAPHGRIALIANQSAQPGELNVRLLMSKWASVTGGSLRPRPIAEKDEIIRGVLESAWPMLISGALRPIVDRRFALADAAAAHERMESSEHIGKLLLVP